MELGIANRTALVAAASRGLGLAVARALAAEGARVAICARGESDLAEAARAVEAAGAERVLARAVDLTEGPAVEAFAAEVERELGPVDLLLTNAGGPPALPLGEIGPQEWEDAWRLTFQSAARLCRILLPGMMERGWGRIVQVVSVSVRQPVADLALSNVVRPAVHALTRTLAEEAAARGVTVNSVAPGFHLTGAVERLIDRQREEGRSRREVLDAWSREIPAGRLGRPEEFAALVAFLMSEPAAYVTGQLIVADGGWVRATF